MTYIYVGFLLAFCLSIQTISTSTAPYLELNDGNYIPMIAYGTNFVNVFEPDVVLPVDARNWVYWAIEAGYRHIDTAALYQDEDIVGQGIADAIQNGLVTRDELFVTTKLWNNRHAKDQVVPALEESLRKLGLDYVDLYLIHTPMAVEDDGSPSDIDYMETWEGMEETKRLGLARSIGVSNFNLRQITRLYTLASIKPAVNQIEVHPSMTQEGLVKACQDLGLVVMASSPFGFLVTRRSENNIPPKSDDPFLSYLSQKYGKTPPQIVLRYLIDRGLIPIPKSRNMSRIAENINIFDFKLTPDEISTMNAFNQNIRVITRQSFKNYPNYPY